MADTSMLMNHTLAPRSLSDLFPPQTFLYMHADPCDVKWVFGVDPVRTDSMGSAIVGIAGKLPLVAHYAGATPEILELFERAGVSLPEQLLTFRSREDGIRIAREQMARGQRLAYAYPPVPELRSAPELLFPAGLYSRLNNKLNLTRYVPEEAAPRRFLLQPEAIAQGTLSQLPYPLFLKAAQPGASGAGRDVRVATDDASWRAALDWFACRRDELDCVVVEEGINVVTSWCLGVSILEDRIEHLGSAIQLFLRPSVQNGNLIDPKQPPPPAMLDLALHISAKAQSEGYRGVAGFDMGVDPDGRCFVFDLNFRLNGSTAQLLVHDAAVRRTGATMTRSWRCTVPLSFADLSKRILPFIDTGVFIPTRMFDRDAYLEDRPGADAPSFLNGLLIGNAVEALNDLSERMTLAVA